MPCFQPCSVCYTQTDGYAYKHITPLNVQDLFYYLHVSIVLGQSVLLHNQMRPLREKIINHTFVWIQLEIKLCNHQQHHLLDDVVALDRKQCVNWILYMGLHAHSLCVTFHHLTTYEAAVV